MKFTYLFYFILLPIISFSCPSPKVQFFKNNPHVNNVNQNETIYYIYKDGEYVEGKLELEPIPFDEDAYNKAVFKEIKYPKIAREKGIQGDVIITVVLDEEGYLISSKVKKGIGAECDKEALKAVKRGFELGFEPAFLNGNAVRVKYDILINFRLQ